MERPVISVCIANYQGEQIIAECIDSVLAQKSAPAFEIIVHDDASSDGSLAALESYDSITLIRSSENVGFCISNNRMAEAATGAFLLFLNNDARLFEDALATLYRESRRYRHEAILGLPQYDASTGELIDRGAHLDFFASPIPVRSTQRDEVAMVIGACMWVPKTIWWRVGGFPPWFVTNAEDVYLCCYARTLGYRIGVPTESGFRHIVGHTLGAGKMSGQRLTVSTRRRHFSERNRLLIQWMFYPAWMIPIVFVANAASLFIEAMVISLINRRLDLVKRIYVESISSAWSERRRVAASRRVIAEARRTSAARFFRPFKFIPQKLRLLGRFGIPRAA